MKLLRGKRVGPRNPVARGFSLPGQDVREEDPSRASANAGRPPVRSFLPGRRNCLSSDGRCSRSGSCKRDGLRAGSRQVAGGTPRAGRRLLAIPAVARLRTVVKRVPSGIPRLRPRGAGQGAARVPGVVRPSHSVGVGGRAQGPDMPRRTCGGSEARSE